MFSLPPWWKRSTPIFCHGRSGSVVGIIGSVWFLFLFEARCARGNHIFHLLAETWPATIQSHGLFHDICGFLGVLREFCPECLIEEMKGSQFSDLSEEGLFAK